MTLGPTDRVHLVGIGGAGMSALAWILLERGHPVSGSDLRGGRAATALRAMGAQVHVGHDRRHVDGADVVAVSTAVPADNPEVVRARELGLPMLRRAELLAALLAGHRGLLIAGTHGKTTVTSMVTVCLQAAGLDPSFAIGGTLHDAGTSAHHGSGDLFVAEADESDGSFLVFAPDAVVVTNIDLDHHAHFADLDAVRAAFLAFIGNRRPQAPAMLCLDDPGVQAVADTLAEPVTTYGEHPDAEVRIDRVALAPAGSLFRVSQGGQDLGQFALRIPGRHNVANAAGAIAAALWAGAPVPAIRQGLERFSGAQRRFQRLGEEAGVLVVDDYAHHPAELTATLSAARQARPAGRIIAAFQPHLYSRTAALGAELGAALAAGADVVLVTDVYGAREAPVVGVTGGLVADAARAGGAETHYVSSTRDLAARLAEVAQPGDLVLTLGAGDITEVGPLVLRRLARGDG